MSSSNFMGSSVGTKNIIQGASQFYATCQKPEILENFQCESFVQRVSNGRRLQNLLDTNKLDYTFSKTSNPTVHGGVLSNGQYSTPEQPSITSCTIRLGHMAYTNEKWDDQMMKYMTADGQNAYREDRNKKTGQVLADKHMSDFMCWLGTQVHPCNEGKNAGVKTGSWDIGTRANPFMLNSKTATILGSIMDAVLNEHNLPGNRAMINPSIMTTMLRNSRMVSNAVAGTGVGNMMAGQCADLSAFAPCGEEIYSYNCMSGVRGGAGGNLTVFPVYYVWKDALDTAYGMDDVNSGLFASDQSAGPLYHVSRQIIKYGFSSIYCQGIARAWVAIDPDWMKSVNCTTC